MVLKYEWTPIFTPLASHGVVPLISRASVSHQLQMLASWEDPWTGPMRDGS